MIIAEGVVIQESVSSTSSEPVVMYFDFFFFFICSCLDNYHKKPPFTEPEPNPVSKPLRSIENVPQPDSCTVFIQHTINSFPHLLV